MQMEGLRAHRKSQAKAYFLQHPEASIKEALADLHRRGINVSERTVAQARSELAQKGLVPAGRNADTPAENVGTPADLPTVPASVKNKVIDDNMLTAFVQGELNLDDEEIRKLLLKKIIVIAMTPGLHPDTTLSASTAWLKLKDMARQADLGPGKPVTRADALERLVDLLRAVGPDLALEAMQVAFNLKEPTDEGQVSVEPAETTSSPAGVASVATSDAPQDSNEGASGA